MSEWDKAAGNRPHIDYLSKDYASFRRLILAHLQQRVPEWEEESAADLGQVLVDALAYLGDYASYYQDAVANEAYLGTARLRRSIRRHTRLLDYHLHEGCNARVWVQIAVTERLLLPAGTQLLTRMEGADPLLFRQSDLFSTLMEENEPAIFELMHDALLDPACNRLALYHRRGDPDTLPRGATAATIQTMVALDGAGNPDNRGGSLESPPPLRAGHALVFVEERDPRAAFRPQHDPARRHAVRLTACRWERVAEADGSRWRAHVEWSRADALPFALRVKPVQERPVSVALGNIALADHGETVMKAGEPLPEVGEGGHYRPRLRLERITQREPISPAELRNLPAADTLHQDPRRALPAIDLTEEGPPILLDLEQYPLLSVTEKGAGAEESDTTGRMTLPWQLQRDLLSSDSLARAFMAEMEGEGEAHLRFGSRGRGRKPTAGTKFRAVYRIGNGPAGNIGPDTLAHVLAEGPPPTGDVTPSITHVANPLPAAGGTRRERLEHARLHAPHAHRQDAQCVTAADYAARAARHPDVRQAEARWRPVGGRRTVFIYVQRQEEGAEIDAHFVEDLSRMLERHRMITHQFVIRAPLYVPLRLKLRVQVGDTHHRSTVEQALWYALSRRKYHGGEQIGFFHPRNFAFGQPVYKSQIVACAMSVPGIREVTVEAFRRAHQGEGAAQPVPDRLAMGPLEIARLNSEPGGELPDRLILVVEGGYEQ